jgi:hypothetical protein
MFECFRARLTGAAQWLTRPPEFACGDCERWRRCGLPPDADCPVRGEQIEREDARRNMRDVMIASEAGWICGRR